MKQSIGNKVAVEAYKKCLIRRPEDIANLVGITRPGLYYNITGQKRWTVDNWLAFLTILGRIEIDGDKLTIHSPEVARFRKVFDQLVEETASLDKTEVPPVRSRRGGSKVGSSRKRSA